MKSTTTISRRVARRVESRGWGESEKWFGQIGRMEAESVTFDSLVELEGEGSTCTNRKKEWEGKVDIVWGGIQYCSWIGLTNQMLGG